MLHFSVVKYYERLEPHGVVHLQSLNYVPPIMVLHLANGRKITTEVDTLIPRIETIEGWVSDEELSEYIDSPENAIVQKYNLRGDEWKNVNWNNPYTIVAVWEDTGHESPPILDDQGNKLFSLKILCREKADENILEEMRPSATDDGPGEDPDGWWHA